jgi:hypothetical protein
LDHWRFKNASRDKERAYLRFQTLKHEKDALLKSMTASSTPQSDAEALNATWPVTDSDAGTRGLTLG